MKERPLEDNYKLAVQSTKNILDKKLEVLEKYHCILREQIKDGIIEVIDESMNDVEIGKITYLSHREVIREEKSSTKLRIVFDAITKG